MHSLSFLVACVPLINGKLEHVWAKRNLLWKHPLSISNHWVYKLAGLVRLHKVCVYVGNCNGGRFCWLWNQEEAACSEENDIFTVIKFSSSLNKLTFSINTKQLLFLRFPYRLETHYIKACAPLTINNQFSTLLSCRICDYAMISFLFWKRVELIPASCLPETAFASNLPVKCTVATNKPKTCKKSLMSFLIPPAIAIYRPADQFPSACP